jgi:hypothetical protein
MTPARSAYLIRTLQWQETEADLRKWRAELGDEELSTAVIAEYLRLLSEKREARK